MPPHPPTHTHTPYVTHVPPIDLLCAVPCMVFRLSLLQGKMVLDAGRHVGTAYGVVRSSAPGGQGQGQGQVSGGQVYRSSNWEAGHGSVEDSPDYLRWVGGQGQGAISGG